MDKIYLVYENSDKTEGRGPMVHVKDSGFFVDEDEAWAFADTICGIMGRKPRNGSWKNEQFGDVIVRVINAHNGEFHKRKRELESKINQAQHELELLKREYGGIK